MNKEVTINKLIYFLLFTLSILFLQIVSSCAPQMQQVKQRDKEKPIWVDGLKHPAYPDSLFILGVGLANLSEDAVNDKNRADADAFGKIANQITSKIKVTDVHITMERATLGRSLEVMAKDSTISVSEIYSDLVLHGLSFVQRHTDHETGIVYSLAVLDRRKAALALKDEIEALRTLTNSCLEQTDNLIINNAFLRALWYAKESGIAHDLASERLAVAGVVLAPLGLREAPWMQPLGSPFNSLRKAEEILANLVLEIAGGDQQKVALSSLPNDPLTVMLYSLQEGKKIPVDGALILFKFQHGRGVLTDSVSTNKQGLASCSVYEVESTTEPFYEISATVDFSPQVGTLNKLPQAWQDLTQSIKKQVTFRLNLEAESVESKAQLLALELAKGLADDYETLRLAMSNLTYQDSRISSSFLNYFQDELENKLNQLPQFQVIKSKDIQIRINTRSIKVGAKNIPNTPEGLQQFTEADGVLVGKCWEKGDEHVNIIVEIIESSSKAALSSSSVVISKEQIPSNLSLLPDNYHEIQKDMDVWKDVSSPDTKLDIKVWVDRMDGGVYNEGEKMQAYLWANKDCYLNLIYHDAAGNDLLIFPNQYRQDNRIIGNTRYPIPSRSDRFDFTVVPPCGVEILKAFACTHPMPKLQGDDAGAGIKRLKLSVDRLRQTLRSIRVDGRPGSEISDTGYPVPAVPVEHAEASCVVTTVAR